MTEAGNFVRDGLVLVGGSVASNPAQMVLPGDAISVSSPKRRFVSRGGAKLEYALDAFRVDPSDRVCLDAGASTGGFTDCLLQRGARLVYAIDVGKGQLHSRIASDARVVAMDRVNVRHLEVEHLEVPPSVVVVDLSFIGLRQVAQALVNVSEPDSDFVVLVKPQFEARRRQVELGGLVRDPRVHAEVLERVTCELGERGLRLHALACSPITGRAGNVEFFGHWTTQTNADAGIEWRELISRAVDESRDRAGRRKEETSL